MDIQITGRHLHVSEPLKEYAEEKISKLDKYSSKLEAVRVMFEVQKFYHISEIVARGKNLRLTAKARGLDMYAAFDKSFDNIQLQMRRLHERLKDHKARRYKARTDAT